MKQPITHELRQAVVQLYEDYADTVDSGDLDAWPGYFTEDCKYRVIARENYDAKLPHATIYCDGIGMVQDRANATRDCTVYEPRYLRHFLHRIRIDKIEDEVIHASGSFLVIECISDKEPCVHMVGKYIDKIVSSADGLRLRERCCVYDNYRIYNSLVFPV